MKKIDQLLIPQKRPLWQVMGWWLSGLLCLGTMLVVALHFSELEQLLKVLHGLKPEWILLAALLQALSYICSAAVWHYTLKAAGRRIAFLPLYALSVAQVFARQALPSSGVSGALLVVRGMMNRGVEASFGLGCMLVGLISFYIAYVTSVLISLAVLALHNALNPLLALMASLLCLIAVSVPAFVLGLRWLDMHNRLPVFLKRRKFAKELLRLLAETPSDLLKNRSLLIRTSLLQISVCMVDSATLSVMLLAVNHPQPYDIVFSSFVMALAAGTVLPVPLGLGTFEGTCVAMLHAFNIPLEAALVAVLLLRGFTFWLPMLPGLWLARRELRFQRTA